MNNQVLKEIAEIHERLNLLDQNRTYSESR